MSPGPLDHEHLSAAADRLVREIMRRDRAEPGFAHSVIARLVAELGPGVLKPAPRSPSDDAAVDVSCLIA